MANYHSLQQYNVKDLIEIKHKAQANSLASVIAHVNYSARAILYLYLHMAGWLRYIYTVHVTWQVG